MPARYVSRQTVRGWLALASEGLGPTSIAERDGYHPQIVSYHLRRHGVRSSRTRLDRAQIFQELAEGERVVDIAARHDASREAVYKIRSEMELPDDEPGSPDPR